MVRSPTDRRPEFCRRYFAELDERPAAWRSLARALAVGDISLLYSSADREHDNAVALRDYLLDSNRDLTVR